MEVRAFTCQDPGKAKVIGLDISSTRDVKFFQKKEIIFCVDLSGSMRSALPDVKASLMAFRDVLLGITPADLDGQLTGTMLEKRLRDNITIKIVGYSSDSWLIYSTQAEDYQRFSPFNSETPSEPELSMYGVEYRQCYASTPAQSFEQAVSNMRIYTETNIGAGVELCYKLVDTRKMSWIVLLSDGDASIGTYQAPNSFIVLKQKAPPLTRIITLGYGDNFSVETLTNLGDFTYVSDSSAIPNVFGSLISEVGGTHIFNLSITAPIKAAVMRPIIGNTDIGCIYAGREYTIAYSCNELAYSTLKPFTVSYYDAVLEKDVTFEVVPERRCLPSPESLRVKYYAAATGRRMLLIYRAIREGDNIQTFCLKMKKELQAWTEPCAQQFKDRLFSFLDSVEGVTGERDIIGFSHQAAQLSAETMTQTSMLTASPRSQASVDSMRKIAGYYSARK
jgi:hypothetical protein